MNNATKHIKRKVIIKNSQQVECHMSVYFVMFGFFLLIKELKELKGQKWKSLSFAFFNYKYINYFSETRYFHIFIYILFICRIKKNQMKPELKKVNLYNLKKASLAKINNGAWGWWSVSPAAAVWCQTGPTGTGRNSCVTLETLKSHREHWASVLLWVCFESNVRV